MGKFSNVGTFIRAMISAEYCTTLRNGSLTCSPAGWQKNFAKNARSGGTLLLLAAAAFEGTK